MKQSAEPKIRFLVMIKASVHVFIDTFNRHSLSTFYVPSAELADEDTKINTTQSLFPSFSQIT